jgi:ankyrin repeat protein
VLCLLRHGARDESNQNGSTALTFASEKARSTAVAVLLQHNANVNVKTNKRGITPLIFAVKARDLLTARLLLDYGAEVNAQTSRTKFTALIAAVRNKDEVQRSMRAYNLLLANLLVEYDPAPFRVRRKPLHQVPPGTKVAFFLRGLR